MLTDVDIFTWKNCNIKGIRVVEFDTEQKRFLRISYHYNLQEGCWYPLRTSSANPQKSILSAKSNGEVDFDDNEFSGMLLAGSLIYTSTLLPDMLYPSKTFHDFSLYDSDSGSRRHFVKNEKRAVVTNAPVVLLYDMKIDSQSFCCCTLDDIIPDSFFEKCLTRRSTYNTHSMQTRTSTSQLTIDMLYRESLNLLKADRNSEKGSLGELAPTLLCLANNYLCKLSIKNEDRHHGTYDGAYIASDTDQPSSLILTESKYNTGNPQKLVKRFAEDYYPTFQKLWNSQAAADRKTAHIMRFMALQPGQNIQALINIGSPVVRLSWFPISIDPWPFTAIYYRPLLNNNGVQTNQNSSPPIQAGITFENMKLLVFTAYTGRNSRNGESLTNLNVWFGFNERYRSGGLKYVLTKKMTCLDEDQMKIITDNFSRGIGMLLDSNALEDKQKSVIKQIAGINI